MKTQLILPIILALSTTLASPMAMSSSAFCNTVFSEETAKESWLEFDKKRPTEEIKTTLDILNELNSRGEIDDFISYSEAKQILENTDLPLYGRILTEVTAQMQAKKQVTVAGFQKFLAKTLKEHNYPESLIKPRVEILTKMGPKDWQSLLGDLSLKEVQQMFYGDDIKKPSKESLLGQYLKETKAATRLVRFPKVQGGTELGPEKLVVAVSIASFEKFQSLIFSSSHFMTVVGHANVIHKGLFYGFGGTQAQIRAPGINTPFPILLFKTSEAQRLNRYMELATVGPFANDWNNALKVPWELKNYCAEGGFTCCTHWLGNIPIGDKLVKEYSFPPPDYGPRGARVQELKKYKPEGDEAILKTVWKVPGHQQLSEVIGQKAANIRGEMASPGWVIQTLLGPTSTERVPLVFVMTANHMQALPEKQNFQFENPR